MVTNRFSLLFRLKKLNNHVQGNVPVYMRITVNSRRVEISIHRSFDLARWNVVAGRATGTKEDAKMLNAYLETLQVRVYETHREILAAKETLTAERAVSALACCWNLSPSTTNR